MCGCESWTIKKAECWRIDAFELWCWRKVIQPVHRKENQSWIFIRRSYSEAETPVFWPPDVKSWLIWKNPDVGKDWRQEEKGTTEDGMVGWHHRLNAHGFGWTLGVGDRQGDLACCGSWSRRVGHDWVTELNWKHTFNIWPRNLRYKYGSILKEISPGCSLERLMLKLKLQYFGHLM